MLNGIVSFVSIYLKFEQNDFFAIRPLPAFCFVKFETNPHFIEAEKCSILYCGKPFSHRHQFYSRSLCLPPSPGLQKICPKNINKFKLKMIYADMMKVNACCSVIYTAFGHFCQNITRYISMPQIFIMSKFNWSQICMQNIGCAIRTDEYWRWICSIYINVIVIAIAIQKPVWMK